MSNEELLELAIKEIGSLTGVAAQMGMNKATISLVKAGKYPNTEHVYKRLREKLGYLLDATVMCPGLKTEIHREVCRKYSEAVRNGKVLGGNSFRMVQDVCPYCALAKK